MQPFISHKGIAAPFVRDNVDTDQIIPSREMKTVSKTGLGEGLFAGQRYIRGREPNPDFVLNEPLYKTATVLLSGKNFGCGSSREHAVWALKDYGFCAVIAESYGEIFYNNCIRNGVLAIQLSGNKIAKLAGEVIIDLQNQTVNDYTFNIPSGDKTILLEGLDAISMTLKHRAEIEDFFAQVAIKHPWKNA